MSAKFVGLIQMRNDESEVIREGVVFGETEEELEDYDFGPEFEDAEDDDYEIFDMEDEEERENFFSKVSPNTSFASIPAFEEDEDEDEDEDEASDSEDEDADTPPSEDEEE